MQRMILEEFSVITTASNLFYPMVTIKTYVSMIKKKKQNKKRKEKRKQKRKEKKRKQTYCILEQTIKYIKDVDYLI